VVVANGVAGPPRVEPPRPVIDGPIRLLYVGRLSERKGVGDAIEAARLLRERGVDADLEIVGAIYPGNEEFEAGLRRTVREAGLDDRVHFRGFDPDIWPWLARADVLLVPSRTDEPFGNTAVEGILAARPVVATGSGGLGEATEGFAAAVTVPPAAPGQIAAAVVRIASDWPAFRDHARRDAETAAARHAPAAYQAAIAAALVAVLPDGSDPGAGGERRAS
jgi:glycosyltransferase involved in cell wall biosynthesis